MLIGHVRVIFVVAALMAAMWARVSAQDEDYIEGLFQEAMAADQANNYKKVVRIFRKIVKEDPENAGMLNNLGVSLMRQAREAMFAQERDMGREAFLEASEWIRKGVEADPTTDYAGENLRAVLVALEANFNIPASEEDKQLLEDIGAPYDEYKPDEEVEQEKQEKQQQRRKRRQRRGSPPSGGQDQTQDGMDWIDEQMGFDESEAPGLDAEIDALFGEGGGERDGLQQGGRKGKGRPSAASKRQWGSEDMEMGGPEEGGFGVDVYGDDFGEDREDRGGEDWLEELAMDDSGEEAPGLGSGRSHYPHGHDGGEGEDEDRELDALMRELDEELGVAGNDLEAAGSGDATLQKDVDALLGEGMGIPAVGAVGDGRGDVDSEDSAAARRRRKRKQRKAELELELEGMTGASSDSFDQTQGVELDRRYYPLSDVSEDEIQARAELQMRNSKIYRQAKRLFWEEEEYRRAAEILCKEDYVRVPVSDKERQTGEPTFRTVEHASVALQVCGFVVLEKLFQPEFIAKMRAAHEPHFEKSMRDMQALDRADLATFETNDAAKRAEKRFEFSNPLQEPWIEHNYMYNPIVRPILKRVIGGIFEIDTFSVVTSVPGAPVQHMHSDASPLFEHGEALTQLPAHGIVQFVAFKNITKAMGPTEFVPASHVECTLGERPKPMEVTGTGGLAIPVCRAALTDRLIKPNQVEGSAVLFDFRVSHRGGPNKHKTANRPLGYTTYMRGFYYDSINFQRPQSKAFDAFTPREKKLLTRRDTVRYIKSLEDKIAGELGQDVLDGMRSDYNYTAMGFKPDKQTNYQDGASTNDNVLQPDL